jgi:hypothetical protein
MPSVRGWVALALVVLPVAGCAQPGGARPVAVWVQPTSTATTATPSPAVAVTPPTTTGPGEFLALAPLSRAGAVQATRPEAVR